MVWLPLTSVVRQDYGYGVAVDADGKIVVAGWSHQGSFDFAVARYHGDGALDASFGADGKVTTDFGIPGTADAAQDLMVVQSDGEDCRRGICVWGLCAIAIPR